MKSLKIILAICVLGVMNGYSQSHMNYHSMIAGSWEIAFPTGNHDFLTKTSLAGGRIEYRRFINGQFSAGLAFSWNSFDEYFNTQTYKTAGGSVVTTDMVRQIYTAPITAIFHYYPQLGPKMIKPYVGVGLGAQYSEQNIFFNIYQVGDDNWGFVVRPEIGAVVMFTENWGALVTFSYNYSTNKNEGFGVKSLQQFGINIGIAGLF